MRAITLWQPWASLIAYGIKDKETRSWCPPSHLIGQRIAIHAAKRPTQGSEMRAVRALVSLPFEAWTPAGPDALPLGVVLATARLVAASRTEDVVPDIFGDYTPGRWAWLLTDIERLEVPVPARGYQGFWTWEQA